ncbi:MAG: hypothetical protein ACOY6K_12565 [Pseudomonadota bacterium]
MAEGASETGDDALTFGWVMHSGRLWPQLRRGMVGSLDVQPLPDTVHRVPAHHASGLDHLARRYPAPELGGDHG